MVFQMGGVVVTKTRFSMQIGKKGLALDEICLIGRRHHL